MVRVRGATNFAVFMGDLRASLSLSPDDALALAHFQELVRIPSISGTGVSSGTYEACAQFVEQRLKEQAIPFVRLEPVVGKPIIIATLHIDKPNLPAESDGIGLDSQGRLLVADCSNDRIRFVAWHGRTAGTSIESHAS